MSLVTTAIPPEPRRAGRGALRSGDVRGAHLVTMFALVLLVRAVLNAGFAGYLWATDPTAFAPLLRDYMRFATVDGVLAWVSAALILIAVPSRNYWVIPFAGGLARLVAAVAYWLFPAIPDVPITLILYLGVIASVGFFVGVLDLIAAERLHRALGRNPVTTALAAVGLASATFGIVLFVTDRTPGTLRWLLVLFCASECLALLATVRHTPALRRLAGE